MDNKVVAKLKASQQYLSWTSKPTGDLNQARFFHDRNAAVSVALAHKMIKKADELEIIPVNVSITFRKVV